MTGETSPNDRPPEIEVSLENDAELVLDTIEIDSAGLPLEFSVEGEIRDIDSDVLARFEGYELRPTAIRFRLLSPEE